MPGHQPIPGQKHWMMDSKVWWSIFNILNLMTQVNYFELNKNMYTLSFYAKICVKIQVFIPISVDVSTGTVYNQCQILLSSPDLPH